MLFVVFETAFCMCFTGVWRIIGWTDSEDELLFSVEETLFEKRGNSFS